MTATYESAADATDAAVAIGLASRWASARPGSSATSSAEVF